MRRKRHVDPSFARLGLIYCILMALLGLIFWIIVAQLDSLRLHTFIFFYLTFICRYVFFICRHVYLFCFLLRSNCAAGKIFGIPLRGTHSHAFVSSFMGPNEIIEKSLKSHDGSQTCENFVSVVHTWLSKLKRLSILKGVFGETNKSELAAFILYALAFPDNFLAL